MEKETGPVIGVCTKCGGEFLTAPNEIGATEILEIFKQNREWHSSTLRITKEPVLFDACPRRCNENSRLQIINSTKAQRIWERIQAARQNGAT